MKKILLFVVMSIFVINLNAQNNVVEKASQDMANAKVDTKEVKKPKNWTLSAMANLNFIESAYVNWAKGGITNFALSTYVDLNANYKVEKMFWNNRLQLDYGFMYSLDKPILQGTKDRMLLESTFGYKAVKNLSYSAKFTFLNQFANGYTYGMPSVAEGEKATRAQWKNARNLKSGFFAPAVINLGLGVDWQPLSWLSINFAPLTAGVNIVTIPELREAYGMKKIAGTENFRSCRFEFGTQITADVKFKVNDNFEVGSHLILFSNYLYKPQNVRVIWDNMLMWKLSKIFTVNLTTSLISDPMVKIVSDKDVKDFPKGRTRVQFAQALQLGISYSFSTKK